MLATLRATLAADLAVLDVPVVNGWPERITPPLLMVVPPASSSYITGGPTFGSYAVSLDVVILAGKAAADVALEALELLAQGVLANTVDWSLTGIDAPALVAINGVDYLGTITHLTKTARL